VSPTEIAEADDLALDPVDVELDEIDLAEATDSPLSPPTVQNDEDLILVFPEDNLKFRAEDGRTFAAAAGDVVGRAETGSDVLQNYPTVSRRHFRLVRRDLRWLIVNLSDNGTWVNGQEAAGGEETPIAPGDELALSSKCRLTVLS
jgi:pSer/pThr/pTyr-binding forkhead associated (FHA) protein